MSRTLTLFDLNLNTSFRNQYLLAKLLYSTFTDDFKLALSVSDMIDYDPDNPQAESLAQKYRKQCVVLGVLDMAVDGLILKDEFTDKPRIVTYGEFFNTYFRLKPNGKTQETRDYYKSTFVD